MNPYTLELFFTNIDNSLYTDEQASMTVNIKADNLAHAELLAERFRKVMDGDHYILKEVK